MLHLQNLVLRLARYPTCGARAEPAQCFRVGCQDCVPSLCFVTELLVRAGGSVTGPRQNLLQARNSILDPLFKSEAPLQAHGRTSNKL